jgi:hypothetical protein
VEGATPSAAFAPPPAPFAEAPAAFAPPPASLHATPPALAPPSRAKWIALALLVAVLLFAAGAAVASIALLR